MPRRGGGRLSALAVSYSEGDDMGEAVTATCPACGNAMRVRAELLGKRVKCPGCGASFAAAKPTPAAVAPETPAVAVGGPGVAPETPAVRAASARGGRGPGRPRGAEASQEATREKTKLVAQLVGLFLLLALVGGGAWAFRTFGGGSNAKPKPGIDDEIEVAIRDESGTEAREWLAASNRRMFGGLNERQAAALLENLYSKGAVKVYAFGGLMTLWLAVELPADPARRTELLDYINKLNADFSDEKKQTDVGQRYTRVRLKM